MIQFFSQSEKPDLSITNQKPLTLIKYLQKYRCLVVFDDIHNIFSSGEFAGKYKPGYEEYRTLFKQIETLSHQSCFILIGWEQPREIPLKSKNTQLCSLQLKGLDVAGGRKILKDNGLEEVDNLETLIQRYQGNPLWLKSVAALIQELGGCATELLPNDTILLPEDLKDILQRQCVAKRAGGNRLSAIEEQVILLLAQESQPVNLAKLLENSLIPATDLLNALQSLSRRCLIEQHTNSYTLLPIMRYYIKQIT